MLIGYDRGPGDPDGALSPGLVVLTKGGCCCKKERTCENGLLGFTRLGVPLPYSQVEFAVGRQGLAAVELGGCVTKFLPTGA